MKNLKKDFIGLFVLAIAVLFVTGCEPKREALKFDGEEGSLVFNVKADGGYKISTDSKDLRNSREQGVLIGKDFKISIEFDDTFGYFFEGNFNKLKEKRKDNDDFKEVEYSGIKGIQYFYGGSVYTQGTFSLIRIWQGKASVAAVIIPLLFYFFISINKRNKTQDWMLMALAGLAGCLMSGMGISITLILIGACGVYHILAYQNWKRIPFFIVSVFPSLAFALTYYCLKGGLG